MRRPFWWVALCVFVLVAAPLATLFGMPATAVRAEPSAPAALRHDQVVVLSTGGQIRAFDLYPQSGMTPANWNSGTDTGWDYIAAGDFNDDGDQEIVAVGDDRIKVFDPFVQPGRTAVTFERTVTDGRVFRLLTTGDFDGDGRDEIATTTTEYNAGYEEALRIYDGGASGNSWTQTYIAYYNALWQTITTGDFSNAGVDDLAMARTVEGYSPFLGVYRQVSEGNWAPIAESYGGQYGFPWITMAAGKLSSPGAPDQLAILRSNAGPSHDSLIMQDVLDGGFEDTFPGESGWFGFNPSFTSLTLGTFVAGQEQQIIMLRDPQEENKTSVLLVDPTFLKLPNGTDIEFELPLDYGDNAWHQVRTGDVNGDGLSEVVILRSDRFRVYTKPPIDDTHIERVTPLRVQPAGTDWPVMVVANLDGPGISSGPTLSVAPTSLSYELDYGAESPTETLMISNSGTLSSFAWQAQVMSGNEWLQLSTTSGSTPGQVYVTVRTNVTPGTYSGTIRISGVDTSVKNSPVDIPVTLKLANPGFVVVPQQLTIWQKIGGPTVTKQVQILRPGLATDWVATALPLSAAANVEQMIASGRITVKDGSAALDGQAVAPPAWLVFTPDSGTTPSTMTVSVQTTTPGKYRGMIVIVAKDTTLTEPVRWVEVDAIAANQFHFSFLPLVVKP